MSEYEKTATWKRFANYIVDIIGYLIISMILGFFLGIFLAIIGNIEFLDSGAFELISQLLGLVVLFFYYFCFELLFAATPGKLITGTRVISRTGDKLDAGTVALRSVIRFVPFEPFSFLFGEGWHDKWSKTSVVDKINS